MLVSDDVEAFPGEFTSGNHRINDVRKSTCAQDFCVTVSSSHQTQAVKSAVKYTQSDSGHYCDVECVCNGRMGCVLGTDSCMRCMVCTACKGAPQSHLMSHESNSRGLDCASIIPILSFLTGYWSLTTGLANSVTFRRHDGHGAFLSRWESKGTIRHDIMYRKSSLAELARPLSRGTWTGSLFVLLYWPSSSHD